jgi:lipoprotein-anchoring transpeptidase ErfK/SrfK
VRLLREAREGRWTWVEIDPGRWVRRDRVRAVQAAEAPAELSPGERWVDIDRTEQTLVAYEGRLAVFATMVSTGRDRNETPPGVFRTWARYLSRTMDNTENAGISGHFRMGDVPWVQFFDADRGLHAVYWHDDFGHARSHGCVNLSPRDAERLFRWARPGVPLGWQSVFMPDREGMLVRIR